MTTMDILTVVLIVVGIVGGFLLSYIGTRNSKED